MPSSRRCTSKRLWHPGSQVSYGQEVDSSRSGPWAGVRWHTGQIGRCRAVRLLICDDHVLFADALAAVFESRGHTVRVTPGPDRVMSEVDQWRPELLMLEVSSSSGEAIDLVAQVVTRHRDVRVLVLSACQQPAVVTAAVDGGAHGYVGKHLAVDALVRTAEQVRQGERVLDPGPRLVSSIDGRVHGDQADTVAFLLSFLTPKEHEVLRRIVVGQSTREMASDMNVSRSTARTHVQNVLSKLGVHSRIEAAAAVSQRYEGWNSALARSG